MLETEISIIFTVSLCRVQSQFLFYYVIYPLHKYNFINLQEQLLIVRMREQHIHTHTHIFTTVKTVRPLSFYIHTATVGAAGA